MNQNMRNNKQEIIINTPKNRKFNKDISRMPFNSINMSEIIHKKIINDIKQFDDEILLFEKRKKHEINYMI